MSGETQKLSQDQSITDDQFTVPRNVKKKFVRSSGFSLMPNFDEAFHSTANSITTPIANPKTRFKPTKRSAPAGESFSKAFETTLENDPKPPEVNSKGRRTKPFKTQKNALKETINFSQAFETTNQDSSLSQNVSKKVETLATKFHKQFAQKITFTEAFESSAAQDSPLSQNKARKLNEKKGFKTAKRSRPAANFTAAFNETEISIASQNSSDSLTRKRRMTFKSRPKSNNEFMNILDDSSVTEKSLLVNNADKQKVSFLHKPPVSNRVEFSKAFEELNSMSPIPRVGSNQSNRFVTKDGAQQTAMCPTSTIVENENGSLRRSVKVNRSEKSDKFSSNQKHEDVLIIRDSLEESIHQKSRKRSQMCASNDDISRSFKKLSPHSLTILDSEQDTAKKSRLSCTFEILNVSNVSVQEMLEAHEVSANVDNSDVSVGKQLANKEPSRVSCISKVSNSSSTLKSSVLSGNTSSLLDESTFSTSRKNSSKLGNAKLNINNTVSNSSKNNSGKTEANSSKNNSGKIEANSSKNNSGKIEAKSSKNNSGKTEANSSKNNSRKTEANSEKTGNHPEETENHPEETENHPGETENHPGETKNHPEETENHPEKAKNNPEEARNNSAVTVNNPDETENFPEETEKYLEDAGNHSEVTGNNAEEIGNNAEETMNNSELSDCNSEETGNNSEETENNPEETGNNSDVTGNNSVATRNNTEGTVNNPEKTVNNPEETENNPEETENNPEETENDPKEVENNPEGTENNPEEIENPMISDCCESQKTSSVPEETFIKPFTRKLRRRTAKKSFTSHDLSTFLLSKCLRPKKILPPLVVEEENVKSTTVKRCTSRKEFGKCPKLSRPAYWATKRLYDFLEEKFSPKYGVTSLVKAERFIIFLVDTVQRTLETTDEKEQHDLIGFLKRQMIQLNLIKSDFFFYLFIEQYLPFEFIDISVPCLVPFVDKVSDPNYEPSSLFKRYES